MKIQYELKDDKPNPSSFGVNGNALDENWYHLYIPAKYKNGLMVNGNSAKLIKLINQLNIGNIIQLILEPKKKNLAFLTDYLNEDTKTAKPYLEVVYGCETAALVHYTDLEEIKQELIKVKERLDHIKNNNS